MTFEQAWPLLEEAANIGDFVTKEETIEGLRSGAFSLFTREKSAAVTADMWPTLRIGLAGGDMSELLEIEEEIVVYAKEHGFTNVEIIGRPGWERVLKGYDRAAVLLRKQI